MFTQVLTITRNTFTESIRQPIYVVLLLLGGTMLGITPMLAAYTLEHGRGDNKMLIDLSLGTIFLAGILLASFTATNVLSKEIDNKTVLTVVSKPVSRPLFVLGKFFGVLAAITMAHIIFSVVFLLTIRHGVMQTASHKLDGPVLTFGLLGAGGATLFAAWANYYLSWPFTSTLVRSLFIAAVLALAGVLIVGPGWVIQSPLTDLYNHDGEMLMIIVGLVMVLEAIMILTAVAITCSTRLGQVMTLLACSGVYLLGLASDSATKLADRKVGLDVQASYFESFGQILTSQADASLKAMAIAAKVLYALVPNLQFLWPADAITQGNAFTLTYFASVSLYACLYTGVVLCIGIALFQTREVS